MKILLKEIRHKKHLTLLQLSLRSGVSVSEISHIETGIRNPKIGVMCNLAKALNVQISDIVDCQKENDNDKKEE